MVFYTAMLSPSVLNIRRRQSDSDAPSNPASAGALLSRDSSATGLTSFTSHESEEDQRDVGKKLPQTVIDKFLELHAFVAAKEKHRKIRDALLMSAKELEDFPDQTSVDSASRRKTDDQTSVNSASSRKTSFTKSRQPPFESEQEKKSDGAKIHLDVAKTEHPLEGGQAAAHADQKDFKSVAGASAAMHISKLLGHDQAGQSDTNLFNSIVVESTKLSRINSIVVDSTMLSTPSKVFTESRFESPAPLYVASAITTCKMFSLHSTTNIKHRGRSMSSTAQNTESST
jgi:hypothetical protein